LFNNYGKKSGFYYGILLDFEGFDRRHDTPPKRLTIEPVKSGPVKGNVLSMEGWNKILDHYYKLHSFDVNTGLPTVELLERLELSFLILD